MTNTRFRARGPFGIYHHTNGPEAEFADRAR
jgi:hypothetical protein